MTYTTTTRNYKTGDGYPDPRRHAKFTDAVIEYYRLCKYHGIKSQDVESPLNQSGEYVAGGQDYRVFIYLNIQP